MKFLKAIKYLKARLELTRIEPFKKLNYYGWLATLPVNIRLGRN
jgi:hypothetical protein